MVYNFHILTKEQFVGNLVNNYEMINKTNFNCKMITINKVITIYYIDGIVLIWNLIKTITIIKAY